MFEASVVSIIENLINMTKSFITTVETSSKRGEGPAIPDRAKEHSNKNGQHNSTLHVLALSRCTLQADPDMLVKSGLGTPDTAGLCAMCLEPIMLLLQVL